MLGKCGLTVTVLMTRGWGVNTNFRSLQDRFIIHKIKTAVSELHHHKVMSDVLNTQPLPADR